MFTSRQMKIIESIANYPQGIYGSKLSESLGVSSRTIRNEIQEINRIFAGKCFISSSNKVGYFFDEERLEYIRDFLFQHRNHEIDDIDGKRREYEIYGRLIFEDELNVYDLADELYLSTASINKIVTKMQRKFADQGVGDEIITHGDMVSLKSSERQIRIRLHKTIKNDVLGNDFSMMGLKYLLKDHFDQQEFSYLYETIRNYFKKEGLSLPDDHFIIIVNAIYIDLVRNDSGYAIEEIGEYELDENVKNLLDYLQSIHLSIADNDYGWLSNFLHTLKISNTSIADNDVDGFSVVIFDEFCHEVLDKYNFDLHSSSEIYENMLIHVEYMIRRIKSGYELLNPILQDVKKNYPFPYEISMLMVHIVYKYLNRYMSDDEISYIAIYLEHFLKHANKKLQVALISLSRTSIMNIVKEWLVMHFGNQLNLIQVPSIQDLDDFVQSHQLDFILSLNETIAHPIIPTYKISSFPTDYDMNQINSMIRKIRINYRFKEVLCRNFNQKLVQVYTETMAFEDVVRDLVSLMKEEDCIESELDFTNDLLLREVNYPTFLNDVFMVPHPIATFAKKTVVAVGILKKPILMDHHSVQLIFILGIKQKQNDDVNVLFNFFKHISIQDAAMKQLIAIDHPAELIDVLLSLGKNIS